MSYARPFRQTGNPFRLPHIGQVTRFVLREARKQGAYLVPLRVFIGLGWLRAATEKLVEPGWRDGSSLATFLTRQMESSAAAFPFYEGLITGPFLNHLALLGFIVMLGQLLVGVAVITGTFTNAALLSGIFMNANFLLAGVPDPSAFYIVIQVVLFVTGAGTVLGVDAWLSTRLPSGFLAVQGALPRTRRRLRLLGALYLALAVLAITTAAAAFGYITDFSPAGSVEDPAAVTVVMLGVLSAYWVIACLRLRTRTQPLASGEGPPRADVESSSMLGARVKQHRPSG